MSAKDKILERLSKASDPLPVHEFNLPGVSQTSISARLRELSRDGRVESVPVPGKRFTAWKLVDDPMFFKV